MIAGKSAASSMPYSLTHLVCVLCIVYVYHLLTSDLPVLRPSNDTRQIPL